ncbi:MAG: helix-turn-helix domain-containing protein [Ruminococcus sp.]|nr:helix-turn-helix domain-containing protein [Clostridia bacterium]MBR6967720.1 helix-turn-helix domain-containing protein [Ruminococcus sp.]
MNKEKTYGINKEELYTLNEVAGFLKIQQRQLYNVIKSGSIEAVKVGREWRVSGEALLDFIKTNTSGGIKK